MKASESTPFIELVYAGSAQDIALPPGVFNLVTGAADVGAAITECPHFSKISFTGSNEIAAKVIRAAAVRCLPVALELGESPRSS